MIWTNPNKFQFQALKKKKKKFYKAYNCNSYKIQYLQNPLYPHVISTTRTNNTANKK